MIFSIYFNFFFDTKSISGKEKILRKVNQTLINKYGVNSVHCNSDTKFMVHVENDKWDSLLLDLIEFSQVIGQQWIITGSINFECSLWSNHSKIVGVSSIGIDVDNVIPITP
ncbi:hypothetical protein [Xenorhabdus japonica]|uniref:Uncharacterized protein n=1 Tax=Xenorhabdus japonica TaxID=53341 RepID=A0A1I4ZB29_9GAMM|nr:hypothetical protein [Xenorhabdus japonica]SFN47466.1 hypothetical protein SAMN05421579_10551 [Xenorhabdus japonica]